MNIPAGTALKTGLALSSVDFFSLLGELKGKKFSGYVALASAGKSGVEEGTMFFDEGKPVASAYEYYAFKKTYYAKDAFERIINASLAEHGIIDVFELSIDQVHLVLAFNESAIYVPSEGEISPAKTEFSGKFEQQLASASVPDTRASLLKKYKLGGILQQEQEQPLGQLREVPVEKDLLEKLAKKEKQ